MTRVPALLLAVSNVVDATITHTANSFDETDLTTYTFSSVSIGTAATGRRIIVGVAGNQVASRTISSLTIGGNAATQVVFTEGSGSGVFTPVGMYVLQVDSGTTANIVVTFSAGMVRCSIGVWAAYNVTSSTATDTGSSTADPQTDTLNINAGGVAAAYSQFYNAVGGALSYSWTGLTENFDQVVFSNLVFHSGASDAFASTQTGRTITADPNAAITAGALVMASFR